VRIVPDVRAGPTDSWLGAGAGSRPVTGPALPRWSKASFKATMFWRSGCGLMLYPPRG
jgi:hypothetical protein